MICSRKSAELCSLATPKLNNTLLWLYDTHLHGTIPTDLPLPFAVCDDWKAVWDLSTHAHIVDIQTHNLMPPNAHQMSITLDDALMPLKLKIQQFEKFHILMVESIAPILAPVQGWFLFLRYQQRKITDIDVIMQVLRNMEARPLTLNFVSPMGLRHAHALRVKQIQEDEALLSSLV